MCCQPKISESHPAPHPGQQTSFTHLLTHLLIHGRPAWSVSEAVSRPNWHVSLTSTACVQHLTSWAYCLTATALNSTASWCDCLLVRVMSCGPGARRKQGWASMEMRATAGKMPLFVRDIVMRAFLPCTAPQQSCITQSCLQA